MCDYLVEKREKGKIHIITRVFIYGYCLVL